LGEEGMIFVFPGQGAQKIGMGKDVYDAFRSARDVFHEVDDAISLKLSDLIFNGTEEELKATENAQPALMTTSIAFLNVLKKEFIDISQQIKFFAGHSLGEYSALCASEVISLSDAANLLKVRGKAMNDACPNDGAMAAIIGLNIDTVEKIVSECDSQNARVQIANDNSGEQAVISGHRSAVEKAMKKAKELNAKLVQLLEVSGPFHSELMQRAVAPLANALQKVNFKNPTKAIISNVTGKAETRNFKELLTKQITERVKWRESILFADANSVSKCVEIGPGKILTGLVKRISPRIETTNINSLESLKIFAENYGHS
jgi:[acyl-carrier-protein] S-malonyltransferase